MYLHVKHSNKPRVARYIRDGSDCLGHRKVSHRVISGVRMISVSAVGAYTPEL